MGHTKFWRENVKEENTWRVLYWEYDMKMELIELRGEVVEQTSGGIL
jgi:hypothetical protein